VTNERSDAERGDRPRRTSSPAWYLVLAIPLVGTLIPPIYNTKDPTVIGIPFFYWYLLLWVAGSVICTLIFYRGTRGER
jgi:uncharacterized protein DUF3311